MSYWNHRIVRKKYERTIDGKTTIDYYYGIHEAFYDKNGKVVAITVEPIDAGGETIDAVRYSWTKMALAFSAPILDFDNIPEEGHDKNDALVKPISEEDLVDAVDMEDVMAEFKITDEDRQKWHEEEEAKRLAFEKEHEKKFVGIRGINKIVEMVLKAVKREERKRK